jgi:lipopolysaccharide export system protein LptC
MSVVPRRLSWWLRMRQMWDRLSVYLPIFLMGLMALATYWLVRNTPTVADVAFVAVPQHAPDYFMQNFSVKIFDQHGRLKSEMAGAQGRHFPDTDTLEIEQPRIRAISKEGQVTTARAMRAVINADGSEVQLFENAVLIRDAIKMSTTEMQPRSELHSEFLHLFANTEIIRTHLPVALIRGSEDRFTADHLVYDNLERILQLQGRVHGTLVARKPKPQ